MLGLADGNFAVWDLRSNETFMSRGKHFSALTLALALALALTQALALALTLTRQALRRQAQGRHHLRCVGP